MVIIDEQNYLAHYGTPRHSGRYPWGSGGNEVDTRNEDFNGHVNALKREGMTEKQIAQALGFKSTTELRARQSIAATEKRQANIAMAQRLKDKGYSPTAISERMGVPNSTVRSWLEPGAKDRANVLESTSNMLKDQVAKKTYVDVGKGNENHLNISKEKLNTAVAMLQQEGYAVHTVPVTQLGTGKETKVKVLAPPGTTWGEVVKNKSSIQPIFDVKSVDGGRTYYGLMDPIKVNPSRVGIVYAEDGGAKSDGVIFVRPGVDDISLGKAKYAQVRIAIGDNHYMKGMAMYKDDMPAGVDLLYHTNKSKAVDKMDVLKPITGDKDNPFGAIVNQIIDKPGTEHEKVTSAMNIVYEEGDWSHWSNSIASQVLSKQSPALARSQLDMTYESRQNEFSSLMSLTNPTVKRKLLEGFADGTDSSAVHLQAAALPRQGWHAILPINTLPPNQIYAPNFNNGELVALIRYPHGGTFEIPELTVNNNHPEAKRLLGNARDAVGIHHDVAKRLSGADFDGDTVLVIPDNMGRITKTPALEGLKDFDHIATYPKYEGMKVLKGQAKQTEMGKISNLITDMTIQKASTTQIAQAVRHSMVVIDAEKHELNWKQSYIDNGIAQLKQEYQGGKTAGAATLISRAGAEVRVPEKIPRPHKEGGPIDTLTGRKMFVETGRTTINRAGKEVPATTKSKALAEVDDAHRLSSGTAMEALYADHSNKLKRLANTARLEAFKTPPSKKNPSSAKVYDTEVKSLNAKLDLAQRQAPLERQAQLAANKVIKAKRDENPNMDDATLRKIKYQALEEARTRTKAKKAQIKISDSEWEAIQANAISESKLNQILNAADMDVVRELATPHDAKLMTTAKTNRAHSMLASGYSRAQVAGALGVSVATLDRTLYGTGEG